MDFEDQCQSNRERNKAILQSLSLDGAFFPPKTVKKPRAPRKRKAAVLPVEGSLSGDDEGSTRKRPRASLRDDGEEANGLRRSGRNRGKQVDYTKVNIERATPHLVSDKARAAEMKQEPRSLNKRIHDPKTFGSIPGIPVGTWWLTREECSIDAVHAPWVAGIAGGPHGAYSVALSGGYEDDIDLGEAFTYTGAGGRDLKGTKQAPKNLRTAPQSCDQSFQNPLNQALKKSSETKKPVRVIRGYKLKSPYAPSQGYRYDGLYTVEKAWMERGLNPKGWKVCKFAFKRMPGQAPLEFSEGLDADEDEGSAAMVETAV